MSMIEHRTRANLLNLWAIHGSRFRPGRPVEVYWNLRRKVWSVRQGGRVLIHCRMGKGRSGMAALRLMIEIGERPTEALQRIRSVHPMAIETHDRMTWALTT